MQQVITITLNPSLDKTTTVKSLVPEKKLRCTPPILESGGGGINVSRALKKLGSASTAMYLSGGYTGKEFDKILQEEIHDVLIVPIENTTRENMIVVDESTGLQYRFGMEGPTVQEHEWKKCLQTLQDLNNYQFVVASGSLPPGVPVDFFAQLAAIVKQKGAKLIIDTSGKALEFAVNEGVYLLKPNLGELSSLYGVEELRSHEIVDAARAVLARGGCEAMAVSMGAQGAMLITKQEAMHIQSPTVKARSTVGAGDSMVAGMVLAITQQKSWKEVLQMGIACGTAATMNHGAELCKKEDVEMLLALIQKQ
ncbi:MAG: 1-phosphofructokinase family hexose kinase [Chitinophagaceae bacterium]